GAWAEAQAVHAQWQAEFEGWESASRAVAGAENALALTEARYAEGLDDITALLRAQAEELAARTREINARFNAVVAASQYRLAVAEDIDAALP
ncbi:MAG TPA: TolC family protein, partial [Wenzhouxiangellaceae bacterium]|nr:TolC family protein [Wenzhouxiangellaceae bacterium]